MKRKSQGASLIVVLIIFMFVSTVSMATLSAVGANYKARVVESKRVENLYASDSGLDVAYNVIGKTFDAAVHYGNLKVNQLKNTTSTTNDTSIYNESYTNLKLDIEQLRADINILSNWNANHTDKPSKQRPPSDIEKDIAQKKLLIEEDENLKDLLINEEFKRSFKNFIAATSDLGQSETAPDKLKDSIETNSYVSEVTFSDDGNTINFTEEEIDFEVKNKNGESPKLNAVIGNISGTSYTPQKIERTADGHHLNVEFNVYEDQMYNDITVTSTFYTEKVLEDGKEKELNKRQLEAKYKMKVPNYEDIYSLNYSGDLHEYLATKDRALTIFGDMNVNNANGLTIGGTMVNGEMVGGEIFVQGSNDHSADNKVYGKYFGGITLNNSKNVVFRKNVITRGTFNIQNGVGATIEENLYARNVYAGNIENNGDDNDSGSTLNVINGDIDKGQVIIDNDLALNLNNTTINIKDFYGINDKDINKVKASSSIIVNGNYSSTNLYITKLAYIMGMAHIDTASDYQTAESGAVKGNYIAYSIPLTDDEKIKYNKSIADDASLTDEEKLKYSIPLDKTENFVYNSPLQLLDPDKTDPQITVQQAKENHFLAYWSQDERNSDDGGIHWPVKDDGSTNVYSIGAIVYKKDNETKSKVIKSKYSQDLFLDNGPVGLKRIEFAKNVYKFGQSANINDYNKTIITNSTSVINIGNIPSEYKLEDQNNKGEYAIFNGENKEIKITKTYDGKNKIDTTDSNVIKIDVGNNDHTINAVIATAGKVSVESGITINGCIIAEGDLDINGAGVTINYVPEVIERVQAQNNVTFKTFRAVFGKGILDNTDGTNPNDGTNTDSADYYDLTNFLEDKSWKILK